VTSGQQCNFRRVNIKVSKQLSWRSAAGFWVAMSNKAPLEVDGSVAEIDWLQDNDGRWELTVQRQKK
jgi:hypothetical protein